MSFRLFIILFIVALYTGACSRDKISEQEKQETGKQILTRLDQYAASYKRLDPDWTLNKFWAKDKEFVIAGDGNLIRGFEEGIDKPTRTFIKSLKEVYRFDFTEGQVYLFSRKAASLTTKFDVSALKLTGDTVRVKGSWIYLFQKFGNEWKAIQSGGTPITY